MVFTGHPSDLRTEAERVLEYRRSRFFRAGLAIYLLSFLLLSVEDHQSAAFGFWCAGEAFLVQFNFLSAPFRYGSELSAVARYGATVPSGWTNVLLAITIWNQRMRPAARSTFALRLFTVATIPSSWLLIADKGLQIREGHAAWLLGIGLALFCEPLVRLVPGRSHG